MADNNGYNDLGGLMNFPKGLKLAAAIRESPPSFVPIVKAARGDRGAVEEVHREYQAAEARAKESEVELVHARQMREMVGIIKELHEKNKNLQRIIDAETPSVSEDELRGAQRKANELETQLEGKADEPTTLGGTSPRREWEAFSSWIEERERLLGTGLVALENTRREIVSLRSEPAPLITYTPPMEGFSNDDLDRMLQRLDLMSQASQAAGRDERAYHTNGTITAPTTGMTSSSRQAETTEKEKSKADQPPAMPPPPKPAQAEPSKSGQAQTPGTVLDIPASAKARVLHRESDLQPSQLGLDVSSGIRLLEAAEDLLAHAFVAGKAMQPFIRPILSFSDVWDKINECEHYQMECLNAALHDEMDIPKEADRALNEFFKPLYRQAMQAALLQGNNLLSETSPALSVGHWQTAFAASQLQRLTNPSIVGEDHALVLACETFKRDEETLTQLALRMFKKDMSGVDEILKAIPQGSSGLVSGSNSGSRVVSSSGVLDSVVATAEASSSETKGKEKHVQRG